MWNGIKSLLLGGVLIALTVLGSDHVEPVRQGYRPNALWAHWFRIHRPSLAADRTSPSTSSPIGRGSSRHAYRAEAACPTGGTGIDAISMAVDDELDAAGTTGTPYSASGRLDQLIPKTPDFGLAGNDSIRTEEWHIIAGLPRLGPETTWTVETSARDDAFTVSSTPILILDSAPPDTDRVEVAAFLDYLNDEEQAKDTEAAFGKYAGIVAVPEPSGFLLMGLSGLLLCMFAILHRRGLEERLLGRPVRPCFAPAVAR